MVEAVQGWTAPQTMEVDTNGADERDSVGSASSDSILESAGLGIGSETELAEEIETVLAARRSLEMEREYEENFGDGRVIFNGQEMILDTGNIIHSSGTCTPADSDEEDQCLSANLDQALKRTASQIRTQLHYDSNSDALERQNLRVSARVFVQPGENADTLTAAVDALVSSVHVNDLDRVTLHIVGDSVGKGAAVRSGLPVSGEDLLRLWQGLERAQKDGRCSSLGLADADAEQFTALAAKASIAPAVLDLPVSAEKGARRAATAAAKARGSCVRAYSASPGTGLLRSDRIDRLMRKYFVLGADKFRARYLAKYTIVDKHRSVVKAEGFILSAVAK